MFQLEVFLTVSNVNLMTNIIEEATMGRTASFFLFLFCWSESLHSLTWLFTTSLLWFRLLVCEFLSRSLVGEAAQHYSRQFEYFHTNLTALFLGHKVTRDRFVSRTIQLLNDSKCADQLSIRKVYNSHFPVFSHGFSWFAMF